MNTAAASVINDSPIDPPIWKSIRKTNAVFRKLALKAEKNWHQNRGANRRDRSKGFSSAISKPPHKLLYAVHSTFISARATLRANHTSITACNKSQSATG